MIVWESGPLLHRWSYGTYPLLPTISYHDHHHDLRRWDLGSRTQRMFLGPSRKEAGTRIYITEIRIDLAKQVFQLHGGDTRSKRCSASNRSQMYHSVSMGPPDTGRSCTSALGRERHVGEGTSCRSSHHTRDPIQTRIPNHRTFTSCTDDDFTQRPLPLGPLQSTFPQSPLRPQASLVR